MKRHKSFALNSATVVHPHGRIDMMHAMKLRAPRRAIRAAGLVVIVAGGWCCWLAFGSRPDVAEPEVLHDWNASQPKEPATTADSQAPRRPNAAITDISPVAADEDDEATVIFAEFEEHPDAAPSIEPVGHAETSPSVWLTGTIEEKEAAERK